MESERVKKLITMLEELRNTVDEHVAPKLEIDKCKRVVQRMSSFSDDCKDCYQYLVEFEEHLRQLSGEYLAEMDVKHHKQKLINISSHLQKQHKLVTSGYYLSIYMSIGTSLGVVFGLLIFDNIGLGLPLGIAMGVANWGWIRCRCQEEGNGHVIHEHKD
ncbi:hypothetical protein [Gracilibacillus lacisalsi]|uniref:hypothetical protein n=1 Tax=Gracilibacillus lacisalsi TaxID=393087 RepID=UPI0003A90539|nr:hypothetical protein [Gracilibacillus lacisalsi]